MGKAVFKALREVTLELSFGAAILKFLEGSCILFVVQCELKENTVNCKSLMVQENSFKKYWIYF